MEYFPTETDRNVAKKMEILKKKKCKSCFVQLTENSSSFDGWHCWCCCRYQQPDKAINNESKMISRFHRYAQRHFVGVAFAAVAAVSICILFYIFISFWKQLLCGGLRCVIFFFLFLMVFGWVLVFAHGLFNWIIFLFTFVGQFVTLSLSLVTLSFSLSLCLLLSLPRLMFLLVFYLYFWIFNLNCLHAESKPQVIILLKL